MLIGYFFVFWIYIAIGFLWTGFFDGLYPLERWQTVIMIPLWPIVVIAMGMTSLYALGRDFGTARFHSNNR